MTNADTVLDVEAEPVTVQANKGRRNGRETSEGMGRGGEGFAAIFFNIWENKNMVGGRVGWHILVALLFYFFIFFF